MTVSNRMTDTFPAPMTTLPIEPVPASRPPSPRRAEKSGVSTLWEGLRGADRSDRIYKLVLTLLALALPVLIVVILGVLLVNAVPALRRFGPSFLWTSTWDPVARCTARRR